LSILSEISETILPADYISSVSAAYATDATKLLPLKSSENKQQKRRSGYPGKLFCVIVAAESSFAACSKSIFQLTKEDKK